MGYNTGVLILNDAVDGITTDPITFAEKLHAAIIELGANGRRDNIDFPIGNYVNGGTVFHSAHADVTALFALGGNHVSKLWTGYNGGKHHKPEEQLAILKAAAEELGYNLVKKPKKKINLKDFRARSKVGTPLVSSDVEEYEGIIIKPPQEEFQAKNRLNRKRKP